VPMSCTRWISSPVMAASIYGGSYFVTERRTLAAPCAYGTPR
jgi:hypothetical protein